MPDKTDATERSLVHVRPEALRQLMERLLVAVGATDKFAQLQANMHFEADLRGVGIQGLDHMFTLIEDLRAGHISPTAAPGIAKDSGSTIFIDGHGGLGVPAAIMGVEIATTRARQHGSCVVGIGNSSDIFLLGFYAELLARKNLVGILATNSPPRVHALGGCEAVVGTNPLAFGIPTLRADPLVLDFATSHWAASYFRQAAYYGEQIPDGLAFGPNGQPTRDPAEALLGAIAPLAGHKGFGLGLCVGILTGPLVGTPTGKSLKGGWNLGHLIIAIDPAAFGSAETFLAQTQAYIDEIKSSRRAPGAEAIRMPGERLFTTREQQLREGIAVYSEVWSRAVSLANELSVAIPRDALLGGR